MSAALSGETDSHRVTEARRRHTASQKPHRPAGGCHGRVRGAAATGRARLKPRAAPSSEGTERKQARPAAHVGTATPTRAWRAELAARSGTPARAGRRRERCPSQHSLQASRIELEGTRRAGAAAAAPAGLNGCRSAWAQPSRCPTRRARAEHPPAMQQAASEAGHNRRSRACTQAQHACVFASISRPRRLRRHAGRAPLPRRSYTVG